MNDGTSRPCLSAIFVDYDNIYLSLKRKNEEAAKLFAKNAGLWLQAIQSGELITPTNTAVLAPQRRVVLNRCYGNPVPRRNNKDNSTDMNSFPFVRHHFLRAGSEIVDCPPLTAQLKNSSDIKMVMDVRDLLNHDTYYDEFIILSGDADFTPVLQRLRAHARRTIIYANDYTAVPYTAICDGEIQENSLINFLINGHVAQGTDTALTAPANAPMADPEALKNRILDEIAVAVSESDVPVPIESLADRAQRAVGHEQTIGTNWVGHGNFLTFLAENLPDHIVLTERAPYLAIDTQRMKAVVAPSPEPVAKNIVEAAPNANEGGEVTGNTPAAAVELTQEPVHQEQAFQQPVPVAAPEVMVEAVLPPAGLIDATLGAPSAPSVAGVEAAHQVTPLSQEIPLTQEPPASEQVPLGQAEPVSQEAPVEIEVQPAPVIAEPQPAAKSDVDATSAIQRSIARIHDACQAPPLAPPEYRMMFELISAELHENNINGQQTISNIVTRAAEVEFDIKRDDVRFIIDVISEADPWFEQGASASLFAGRFRNFVVARCRGQGLKLTADELDLIDAWFAGRSGAAQSNEKVGMTVDASVVPMVDGSLPLQDQAQTGPAPAPQVAPNALDKIVEAVDNSPIDAGQPMAEDELPRIVRSRMRG